MTKVFLDLQKDVIPTFLIQLKFKINRGVCLRPGKKKEKIGFVFPPSREKVNLRTNLNTVFKILIFSLTKTKQKQ